MRVLEELLQHPHPKANSSHEALTRAILGWWKRSGHTIVFAPPNDLQEIHDPAPYPPLGQSFRASPALLTGFTWMDHEAALLVGPCPPTVPGCLDKHRLVWVLTPNLPVVPYRVEVASTRKQSESETVAWVQETFPELQQATGVPPLRTGAELARKALWLLQKLQTTGGSRVIPATPVHSWEQAGRTWVFLL